MIKQDTLRAVATGPQPKRQWTVYLLHHSHTDIGYTETQRRIESSHRGFTDQALQILRDHPESGFVWNNECHWAIEAWWRDASPESRQELASMARAGRFGLSGTYAHFTELIDDATLRTMLARGRSLAEEIGTPHDSAISADINGFGWGYSQALVDNGIQNLIVFLHAHHGLTPLTKRQSPFWWKTPKGDRLLVWLGEHYNLGNILGLCPRGHLTHGMKDEWSPKQSSEDGGLIARTRLPRYLRQLELDNYPENFVVMGISGTMSDNAPPNFSIAKFADEWNAESGEQIRIEMTTPAAFAAKVREHFKDIPEHRGDWPDWWSDGFASQPFEVRLCRHAQREYTAARSIASHLKLELPPRPCAEAEQAIALYCEHTFGHADSISMPWDGSVKMVGGMKRCFAYNAAAATEEISRAVDAHLEATPLEADRPFHYRVVNSTSQVVRDTVQFHLEASEFGTRDMACRIIEIDSGSLVLSQKVTGPRGMAWSVWLELQPFECRDFEMEEAMLTLGSTDRCCTDFSYWGHAPMPDVTGAEGRPSLVATTSSLETAHVKIEWTIGGEINSWINQEDQRDLLAGDRAHGPLTPVYERTVTEPANDATAQILSRGKVGRNRKGADVIRSAGVITHAEALSAGPLFASVRLDYQLPGCSLAQLTLTAWKDAPRVDVAFRVNKDSVWDPESLYLSLPFSPSASSREIWIDKVGARMRPSIDQLPESLTDFYTMQYGYSVNTPDFGIAVACPDAPLLQLGPLDHGPRLLMGSPELVTRPFRPYSWIMTNYWETNFEASLGGFHEFRYRIEWGSHLASPDESLNICATMSHPPRAFRSKF